MRPLSYPNEPGCELTKRSVRACDCHANSFFLAVTLERQRPFALDGHRGRVTLGGFQTAKAHRQRPMTSWRAANKAGGREGSISTSKALNDSMLAPTALMTASLHVQP